MKRKPQILFIIFIVAVVVGGCESHHQAPISDNEFQKQISAALHLKRLYSNNAYSSSFLKVLNDTIVGIVDKPDIDSPYLFTQCLKNGNIQKLKLCKNEADTYGKPQTQIEQLKNGCLYFPRFARGTMLKICPDCKFKESFKAYDHIIVYAKQLLFFKNQVIINGFRSICIFDSSTEKLLWKFQFAHFELDNSLINIYNHELVFTYRLPEVDGKVNTQIICVDLNNFRIIWTKILVADGVHLGNQSNPPSHIVNSDSSKNLVIPTLKHFLILNFETGTLIFDIALKQNKLAVTVNTPSFVLNNDSLYVSIGNTTSCFNVKSKSKIWHLSNFKILGDHNAFLIGLSADEKYYLIVSKKTGLVVNRILNPDLLYENIKFVGRYILVRDKVIYK